MIIFIDENISPHLARALHELESRSANHERAEVYCIQDHFNKGIKDLKLIPKIGDKHALWITINSS